MTFHLCSGREIHTLPKHTNATSLVVTQIGRVQQAWALSTPGMDGTSIDLSAGLSYITGFVQQSIIGDHRQWICMPS